LIHLPEHFEARISISGIAATDIFNLGGIMAAAIEDNFVSNLNRLREEWDPDDKYSDYYFLREAEIFPDVRLVNENSDDGPLLGIELKSWYLLSKEREPSARFKTTASVCAPWDLFVMFPWTLENVLSGEPQIFKPYVKTCRYLTKYRNYWWQNLRRTESDTTIESPDDIGYYPKGRELIEDKPAYDGGGNFGRIARTRIMDDYVKECMEIKVAGVAVEKWIEFLKSVK
jgi:hypothetical protein